MIRRIERLPKCGKNSLKPRSARGFVAKHNSDKTRWGSSDVVMEEDGISGRGWDYGAAGKAVRRVGKGVNSYNCWAMGGIDDV